MFMMAESLDEEEPSGLVPKALFHQQNLEGTLSELTEISDKKVSVQNYLNDLMGRKPLLISDFGSNLEWLNTSRPISLHNDLKGRIVVLDFFTYCCINCIHLLPHLHVLEDSFPINDGLVVVGVHSAKFENEKILKNIAEAVLKYDISHPVVNDPEAKLWNELQVFCWPTIVILGPQGQILFTLVGEEHADRLLLLCEVALIYFKEQNKIINTNLPIKPLKSSLSSCSLLYPGKVNTNPEGKIIVIADSAHNRILLVDRNGVVEDIIGGLEPGFQDGAFHEARFHFPQGIVWKNPNLIYVADVGNHAIRQINLVQRVVQTVAGNGTPGNDKEGGKLFTQQALSSPWDLCLGPSAGTDGRNEVLYIAMAGSHQIWVLFLEDSSWLKGSYYKKGTCIRFAGSGTEENRNNIYHHMASFAQPSGITVASPGKSDLYVADSESSTVRSISLKDGSVKGIVGGDKNPSNLFAFGDQDGDASQAKLQHPLGIASKSAEELFVADSYNHKIKLINPKTKNCTTFCGSGSAGNRLDSNFEEVEFNEPGGICITDNGKTLLVADTNNHVIKVIDLEKKSVTELPLSNLPDSTYDVTDSSTKDSSDANVTVKMPPVKLALGSKLSLDLNIQLDDHLNFADKAPQKWNVFTKGSRNLIIKGEKSGLLHPVFNQPEILLMWSRDDDTKNDTAEVHVLIRLFLCQKSVKLCFCRTIEFILPVMFHEDSAPDASVSLHHVVSV